MRYTHRLLMMLLVLASLSVSVMASYSSEYPVLGGDGHFSSYTDLTGAWNTQTKDTWAVSVKGITNDAFKTVPKVAYMDDGIKYIIAFSGGSIRLYIWDDAIQALRFIDGYQVEHDDYLLDSDLRVYTVDNHAEIVFALKEENNNIDSPLTLHMVRYNGSAWSMYNLSTGYNKIVTYRWEYPSGTATMSESYAGGDTLIGCDDDACVAAWQNSIDGFRVMTFDRGGILGTAARAIGDAGDGGLDDSSFPSNGNIYMGAMKDGDSDIDIIFSVWGDHVAHIVSYNVNSTYGGMTLDYDYELPETSYTGGQVCNEAGGSISKSKCSLLLTSIMLYDYDGTANNGLEIFIGTISPANNLDSVMYHINADGSGLERHPDTTDLEGLFISNPINIECEGSNEAVDVGILAYDDSANSVVFMCVSAETFYEECEYIDYELTGVNITNKYNFAKSVHSFQATPDSTSEIMTPVGVLDVEDAWFALFPSPFCSARLTKLMSSYDENSISIPVDYQDTNTLDYITGSETLLSYHDDSVLNTNAYIGDVTLNPCRYDDGVPKTWMLDTMVYVRVPVIDPDSNLVQARAVMYSGTAYADDSGWMNLSASGTDFEFYFTANHTAGGGIIKLYARDDHHSAYITEDIVFSVGNITSAISYGDCSETIEFGAPSTSDTTVDEGGDATNTDNNAIKGAFKEVGAPSGLGVGVMAMLFIFVITGATAYYLKSTVVTLITGAGLMVLGVGVGVLPMVVLIVMVVISAAILTLAARGLFTGDS